MISIKCSKKSATFKSILKVTLYIIYIYLDFYYILYIYKYECIHIYLYITCILTGKWQATEVQCV